MALTVPREIIERARRNAPNSSPNLPKFGTMTWRAQFGIGASGSVGITSTTESQAESLPSIETPIEPIIEDEGYYYLVPGAQIADMSSDTDQSAYIIVDTDVQTFAVNAELGLPLISFVSNSSPNYYDNSLEVTNYPDISSSFAFVGCHNGEVNPCNIYVTNSITISTVTDNQYTFSYFNTGSQILGFESGTTATLQSISSYPDNTKLPSPSSFNAIGTSIPNQVAVSWIPPVADTTTGAISGYIFQERYYPAPNGNWTDWKSTKTFTPGVTGSIVPTLTGGIWIEGLSGLPVFWNGASLNGSMASPRPKKFKHEFRLAAISVNGEVGMWATNQQEEFVSSRGRRYNEPPPPPPPPPSTTPVVGQVSGTTYEQVDTYIKLPIYIRGTNNVAPGTILGVAQDFPCDQAYGVDGNGTPGPLFNEGYTLVWGVVEFGYGPEENRVGYASEYTTINSVSCVMYPSLENVLTLNGEPIAAGPTQTQNGVPIYDNYLTFNYF